MYWFSKINLFDFDKKKCICLNTNKVLIFVFNFRLASDEACFNITVVKGSHLINGITYLQVDNFAS